MALLLFDIALYLTCRCSTLERGFANLGTIIQIALGVLFEECQFTAQFDVSPQRWRVVILTFGFVCCAEGSLRAVADGSDEIVFVLLRRLAMTFG